MLYTNVYSSLPCVQMGVGIQFFLQIFWYFVEEFHGNLLNSYAADSVLVASRAL